MKRVDRSELLGLGAYEQVREHFRARVMMLKDRRRTQLGPHMSIVFENHDTVLLQIQEMLRAERISDERGIAHELDTYNELIPEPGSLSATLFIEYEDPVERSKMLGRFASLRQQLALHVGPHRAVTRFTTHFGEELERLPAVNYLHFAIGLGAAAALRDPKVPAALVVSHPDYPVEQPLPAHLREELARDLEN
ncbi:MAG: DUF3501 family protein [Polyangiales bacterium]